VTSQAFLELSSVRKTFGEHVALSGCSLAIQRGEFITLLGPSGCGKTTTLRLIAGFLRPDAGQLTLDGEVLSSATVHVPPEARNMGMVFQSFAIWPHMTVFDNVALPLRVRRMRKADVREHCLEALRLCRLEHLASRDPHQLSGGQLQRVALARALVYKPSVLLLDEPLSNLDALLREEMRHEIRAIHQAIQTTFVLVTHDQVEAMSLSDRVVVMSNGRIEQIGTPREIYEQPRTSFVAHFVGAANLLDAQVIRFANGSGELGEVQVGDLRFHFERHHLPDRGSPCKVAIHSEAVHLGRVSNGARSNTFEGRVRDVFFLGRTQEVVVDVGGIRLRSTQFHAGDYAPHDVVSVHVRPPDVMLM
jgi:iron(III) transport system ATP-binding protein